MIDIEIKRESDLIDSNVNVNIKGGDLSSDLYVELLMVDEFNQKWVYKNNLNLVGESFSLDEIIPKMRFQTVSKRNLLKAVTMSIFNSTTKKVNGDSICNYRFLKFSSSDQNIAISIYKKNKKIITKNLVLKIRNNKIKTEYIKIPINGKYYSIDKSCKKPGIIIIGGSGSGFAWSEQVAALLASYGYNTLAVSYFDYKGRDSKSKTLTNIPLEYFKKSIDWLNKRPEIINDSVGIIGISKGAEAALLIGSNYPDQIKSIAVFAPPCYSFEGVYLGKKRDLPSWTINNKPINYIPYPDDSKFSMFVKHGYLKEIHTLGVNNLNENEKKLCSIDINSVTAKLLLISGSLDNTWPSEEMCNILISESKNSSNIKHINYKGAGHMFLVPGLPPIIDNDKILFFDSYNANCDAWKKLKEFLEETLKNITKI